MANSDVQALDERLSRVEKQNEQILRCVMKKKDQDTFFSLVEENKERGNWSGRFDFFLSCLGYAVGLGNVWRFPYLAYKNGGGAFFIPYCIFLGIVGIPIFFMELSLGQYSSCGPVTCWKFAPLFTGIGYGMVAVSALVAIYYNMIIAWAIYYLFASFTSELPWETCIGKNWSTELCYDNVNITDEEGCTHMHWNLNKTTGVCYDSNGILRGMFNESLAKSFGIKRLLPSQEYFDYVAIGQGKSGGIDDLGPVNWKLVLCYLAAFIFVVLTLSQSIKTSGKVVYFTATFPYVVLIILFVRGLTLDGFRDGIDFYITPDLGRLRDSQVWKDAAVQIFFSLSASWGGLIALSSYNRFHNDCLSDAITVALGNCLTSFFAGFVIFSYLGNLASILDVPVGEVADSGPSLAFVVYPYAVTKIPPSPFWAIIFFLMLITLGVDSEFVLVETVTTSTMDRFPTLRKYKFVTVLTICLIFFLFGLTLTTNGGNYMLTVMDDYSGGWNVLVIALLECISVAYVYGVRRFLDDIETMIGKSFCGPVGFPWFIAKWWWAICWSFLTPLAVSFVLVFSWVTYEGYSDNREKYPEWADALGWMMTLFVLVTIFVASLCVFIWTPGSFEERMRYLTHPSNEWGPALVKHRREAKKFIDKWDTSFEVDPLGKEALENEVSPNDINIEIYDKSGKENQAYVSDRM
ncbi:sodium- and chloride-dependent neutral and basic amino acid transporter B(0+)-like [Mytilus californianus]|uniref:sodium- and chloride-dependent neutral and basic amino acid transporter B(0+)-like n=1 Tax=Mytilus californianus TaxID=6549 RepID=UPI0022470D3D|nr:sodium- and chloride-dependent neutral and basic amino acid transporter B(0+)-like [Mytilus californianus]